MKKIITLISTLSLTLFLYSQGTDNQTVASSLRVQDTRNINNPPLDYKQEMRAEFKQRDVLGVPGEGMYSGNLTFASWLDNSAGKNHQLNFNDGGIFY